MESYAHIMYSSLFSQCIFMHYSVSDLTGIYATFGVTSAEHGVFVDVVSYVGRIANSIIYDWDLNVVSK